MPCRGMAVVLPTFPSAEGARLSDMCPVSPPPCKPMHVRPRPHRHSTPQPLGPCGMPVTATLSRPRISPPETGTGSTIQPRSFWSSLAKRLRPARHRTCRPESAPFRAPGRPPRAAQARPRRSPGTFPHGPQSLQATCRGHQAGWGTGRPCFPSGMTSVAAHTPGRTHAGANLGGMVSGCPQAMAMRDRCAGIAVMAISRRRLLTMPPGPTCVRPAAHPLSVALQSAQSSNGALHPCPSSTLTATLHCRA